MRFSSRCLSVAVLGFLLSASITSAQVWAGRGRVSGIVTDAEKNPIVGAKVTLFLGADETNGPAPKTTDKKGRWSALGLATGDWTVRIEAEGYKISEGTAHVISEAVGPGETVRVTLNPIPKEITEAAQGPDPNSMIERGNILMNEQKWAEARTEFQNAIAIIEDVQYHPAILRGISRTYFEEKNSADARKVLEQALTLAPEDQDTLKLIVTLLMADGKEAEAETYRSRIVDGFKVDPNSLLNLGIQRFNEGKMDEAMPYFERVISENPDLPDGYYYRALCFLNQGKNAEAKADLEKLIALNPDHSKAPEAREFLKELN